MSLGAGHVQRLVIQSLLKLPEYRGTALDLARLVYAPPRYTPTEPQPPEWQLENVEQAVKVLETAGWVEREREPGNGGALIFRLLHY